MIKIKLGFFSKLGGRLFNNKAGKDFIFLIMAVAMLVLVVSFVIWSLLFLISNFQEAFTEPAMPAPVQRFDIEGFKNLKLIR